MSWLTPAVETNVAYAACVLLFGLLVLSVRNRKMATRSPYTLHASSWRGTSRPTLKNNSAQGLRRATTPAQHSGLLLSTGLEYTPREQANTKAPDSFANVLAAPLEFPARHISEEVKMNSPSFPFESLNPVALAEISASALSDTTSTIQVHSPASPNAYGL